MKRLWTLRTEAHYPNGIRPAAFAFDAVVLP